MALTMTKPGLALVLAHRSTYSTSAPRFSSAGRRSSRAKVDLPVRRGAARNTPELAALPTATLRILSANVLASSGR
ncbi:hypothetical protein D3C78_1687050 [compost metagenome]